MWVVRLSSVVVNITGHVLPKVRLKGEVLKVFSSSGHRPSCRAMTATSDAYFVNLIKQKRFVCVFSICCWPNAFCPVAEHKMKLESRSCTTLNMLSSLKRSLPPIFLLFLSIFARLLRHLRFLRHLVFPPIAVQVVSAV